MTCITLSLENDKQNINVNYEYKCRENSLENSTASAIIPAIQTKVSMYSDESSTSYFKEGYAFSPMFTLGIKKHIGNNDEVVSWLNLEKAN